MNNYNKDLENLKVSLHELKHQHENFPKESGNINGFPYMLTVVKAMEHFLNFKANYPNVSHGEAIAYFLKAGLHDEFGLICRMGIKVQDVTMGYFDASCCNHDHEEDEEND